MRHARQNSPELHIALSARNAQDACRLLMQVEGLLAALSADFPAPEADRAARAATAASIAANELAALLTDAANKSRVPR